MLNALYYSSNCHPAFQLNWSLSLFWNDAAIPSAVWLNCLQDSTEPDSVRILEHHQPKSNVSQFLLSTLPSVRPSAAIRTVKARLQYLVHKKSPRAFRRNYSIQSVGSVTGKVIDNYVASQLDHHRMADPKVQARLEAYQYHNPAIDLSLARRSSHGEFVHNLHLVLVYRDRAARIADDWLRSTHDVLLKIANKKGHLLARAGITADHLHLLLGAGISDSPEEVALAYMNNVAWTHGMKELFSFGYYVGTCGRFDLNAIRRRIG